MGGYGSGRYSYYGIRNTTDDYLSISINKWKKLLTPGNIFSCNWSRHGKEISSISVSVGHNHVNLIYKNRNGSDWKNYNYQVKISFTPCTLGGSRPWFICPAVKCGRRVGVLYGGAIFACRHCYNLAYKSQRESEADRACRHADKIRNRLDWVPGILNGHGLKPKGMHWKTFDQLCERHDLLVDCSFERIASKFGIEF